MCLARGAARLASLALQGTRSSASRLQGQAEAWRRVPEARAAWRSAHSRALLATAARGRSGVSARPPCRAGGRAPGYEVSEAPLWNLSGTRRRAGALERRDGGPGLYVVPALQRRWRSAVIALRIWLRRQGRGFRWGLIRETLLRFHCACVPPRDRNSRGIASRPPERGKAIA